MIKKRLHPFFDIGIKFLSPVIIGIVIFYYVYNYKINMNTWIIWVLSLLLVIISILLFLTVRVWYDSEFMYVNNFIKKDRIPLIQIKNIRKPFFYIYKLNFKEKTKFGRYILISCELRDFSDNKRIKNFKRFMAKKFPENEFFQNELKKINKELKVFGITYKKGNNGKSQLS